VIFNIGLIDYGMGNLHSVQQAFKRLDQPIVLVKGPNDLKNCKALVLPGVGSFDPAMNNLQKTNLIPYLKDWVSKDKPLLGICLGLQLLFEASEEGSSQGLGLLKGTVRKLPVSKNERIPHMGWSKLKKEQTCPLMTLNEESSWMYFVHSYWAEVSDQKDLAASVPFGGENITAIVWRNNLGACQFHPEKSSKAGQLMLFNWLKWLGSSLP
tara:strand:+ start:62537 stop:63169 length:633 start_codon:yes stop_codon:yes gene_type:complete